MFCFFKNAIWCCFLNENKGFKYCFFLSHMLQMYSEGCGYCFWGQRSSPLFKQFKVYGTWQLVFSQTLLSVQQRKIDKLLQSDELKSTIKHYYRHKRQTVVFSHVRKLKTDRCWNQNKQLRFVRRLPERWSP